MARVTGSSIAILLRALRAQGFDVEGLAARLPAEVVEGHGSIDWATHVELLAQTEELVGGPEAMVEVGRGMAQGEVLGPLQRVVSFALTGRQLYQLMARFTGPSLFGGVTASLSDASDGRLHVRIDIDEELEGSLPFFRVTQGSLETAPRMLRLSDSLIEAELDPHHADFMITLPPSASLFARIGRTWELFRASRTAIDELGQQHDRLHRSYAELERAHRGLRREEERFRRITENATDIIAEWDERGNCVYVSPSVESQLGWRPEEVLGDRLFALVHSEDAAQIGNWASRRSRSEDAGRATFRLRSRDGDWRWFEGVSRAMQTEGGDRRIVTVARDVTERLELEEQLRRSQKLEAVGQLAGGVAHDFNNLLTVVSGYAETLVTELRADSQLSEAAQQIQEASAQATRLTRQLLAFSRKDVVQTRVICPNDAVARMERILRPLLGEGISLSSHLDPDVGAVRVDPSQLEQVIMNLAVNARDAMGEGGRLSIETSELRVEGDLAAQLDCAPGRYVRLRVADSGNGITPEVQQRIFDPFFTTKEVGTGLGLSTVYGIVRKHGGGLHLESAVGKGSTFDVYLPRSEEQPQAVVEASLEADGAGAETILLVEDQDAVRSVMRNMLERCGYRVLPTRDAREAEETCAREGDSIDLLLTDVVMPGVSGPELARRIRSTHPRMKVLFVSGYTQGAGESGPDLADNLLLKPFSMGELSGRVRAVLQGE